MKTTVELKKYKTLPSQNAASVAMEYGIFKVLLSVTFIAINKETLCKLVFGILNHINLIANQLNNR
jgi:hypothetical protein